MESATFLEQAREKFRLLAKENSLMEEHIHVAIKPLSPQEAIGNPVRQDYPLLAGREIIVEADFRQCYGQAFTDQPQVFDGSLSDVLELPLDVSANRAIFLSTLNAITGYLGIVDRVRHCHDEEPEECAKEIAMALFKRFGRNKIGIIGYQPAILENLSSVFGPDNVRCTDLSKLNIQTRKFGVEIWDGMSHTAELIRWSDNVLATSSSLANGTFDNIYQESMASEKNLIVFGITGAGVAALMDIERICFYGH